jgi:hypothetical protein
MTNMVNILGIIVCEYVIVKNLKESTIYGVFGGSLENIHVNIGQDILTTNVVNHFRASYVIQMSSAYYRGERCTSAARRPTA